MSNKIIIFNRLTLFLLLLIPILCPADENSANNTVQANIIHFSEYKQGIGDYPVIITITPGFLRIDDTIDSPGNENGFVLFNRREKVIYSVDAEQKQIIKIRYSPVSIAPPIKLDPRTRKLDTDEKAPLIDGKKTEHYQFIVNDKLCYELVSVSGLMPDAVTAMKSFKQVLAGQQAETLRYLPADVHEACDLVKHTFHPELYLDKGFPVLEKQVKKNGTAEEIIYSRQLINFIKQDVLNDRFVLPDYQVISIN